MEPLITALTLRHWQCFLLSTIAVDLNFFASVASKVSSLFGWELPHKLVFQAVM